MALSVNAIFNVYPIEVTYGYRISGFTGFSAGGS